MIHHETSALIIGGTQGLGLAIARALVDQGCTRIVITGRDVAKGQAAAQDIGATFMALDLACAADVIACVNRAADAIGGITALVNAAALTDRGGIRNTSITDFDNIMAANTRAPFFAIQTVANRAIAAGHPAQVVNILSMAAHCGQSFLAPYSASKAALLNITKNAANALRHDRIRVNGLNCGWMDTPGEDMIQRKYHGGGDDWLQKAEAAQPMGMLVKPDHVAMLAAYLLGSGSGVITGSIIDFDQNVAGSYPE